MNLHNWMETNLQYGRKLALLGVEGAGTGGQDLLRGQSLTLFLSESLGLALTHATAGACVGIIGAYLSRHHRPARRALACGAMCGVIGFGAGLTWRTHRLASGMGRGALKKMSRARDQRWLEKHPINYA